MSKQKKNTQTEAAAQTPNYKDIVGTENADYLVGSYGYPPQDTPEHIKGFGGDDNLIGNSGSDWLEGGAGADRLFGGSSFEDPVRIDSTTDRSNDILDGGAGDDFLSGGLGNDTYIWGKGYGNDRIEEISVNSYQLYNAGADAGKIAQELSANTIRLTNLKSRDIEITSNGSGGSGFSLKIKSTGETLQFRQNFISQVSLEFANGEKWNNADILSEIYKNNDGNDKMYGFSGVQNYLDGGNGHDLIIGGQRDDVLLGGRGNDNIFGGSGNNIIRGGAGRDTLVAGAGVDHYEFGYGSGVDILVTPDLSDYEPDQKPDFISDDSIVLDRDVKARDVKIFENGDTLIVQLKGRTDRFEVDNIFNQVAPSGFHLQFADGTQWDIATLHAKAKQDLPQAGQTLKLADNLNTLAGSLGSDILTGNLDGNTILGRAGDDFIDGKGGYDIINGGEGKDTIFFNRQYGHTRVIDAGNDVIKLAKGITASDITTHWDFYGYNLSVNATPEGIASGNVDVISIKGFETLDPADGEGTVIEFADGTRWTQKDILEKRYNANDGDNQLMGTAGNDVIDGKGGYDLIIGFEGDDILHGGDGWDEIWAGEGNDKLYSDAGGSLLYGGMGDDVLVGGDDQDSLYNFDYNGTGSDNDIYIGHAGSDTAVDYYGDDTYDMGTGDDRISDHSGTNTIILKGEFGQDTLETYIAPGNGFILDLDGSAADYHFTMNEYGPVLQKGDNALIFNKSVYEMLALIKEVRYSDGTILKGDAVNELLIDAFLPASSLPTDDIVTDPASGNILSGGDGNDTITTQTGDNYLLGGNGNDIITGSEAYNFIAGGNGDDIIKTLGGSDSVFGGAGDDTINGVGYLFGNSGNDTITVDVVSDGYSILDGGTGNDLLMGNAGLDTYQFNGEFGNDIVDDDAGIRLTFSGAVQDYHFSLNDLGNLLVSHGEDSLTVLGDLRTHFTIDSVEFGSGYLELENLKDQLRVKPAPSSTAPFEAQVIALVDAMAGFKTAAAETSSSLSVVENNPVLISVNTL